MPRSAPHRIFGLDILRAFAIAAVVYGHYQEILGSPFPSLPYFDGVIGVELFFVLSGFLIGGIVLSALRSGRFQGITGVQDFWHRRWYRTFPNYFLFLALAAGLQWSTVSGADLLRYVSFTQNFAWKMPVFFAVSWTLAIEEWFYILLPLLVIGLRAAGLGWKKTFGFSALLLLGASIAYALTLESAPNWESFDEYFRKITLCRMSGLMVGVLLAYAKEEMPALWSRMLSNRIILTGPLVLLIYLSFIHDGTSAWFLRSTSGRILFFPIYDLCCALLLPLMASIGGAQGMAAKTIEWLSKVSYSAYLSHLPVLQLLRFLIGERHLPWLLPISIATTLAVSSALYRFWESPWLSRRTVSSIPAR